MIRVIHWLKCFVFGTGVLILLGVLFHRPVLRALGSLVVYEKADFDQVDAVVVPSGMIPDRVLQAVDLIRESRADLAILFRQELPRNLEELRELGIDFSEDHEINREVLLEFGVDATRVHLVPDEVDSTWEEAEAFKRYLAEQSLESIVISTCQFHSYRAYLNFAKALEGTGVEIYSVPSKYCEFDPKLWWTDRDQIKRLYVELASLTAFFLGRR